MIGLKSSILFVCCLFSLFLVYLFILAFLWVAWPIFRTSLWFLMILSVFLYIVFLEVVLDVINIKGINSVLVLMFYYFQWSIEILFSFWSLYTPTVKIKLSWIFSLSVLNIGPYNFCFNGQMWSFKNHAEKNSLTIIFTHYIFCLSLLEFLISFCCHFLPI